MENERPTYGKKDHRRVIPREFLVSANVAVPSRRWLVGGGYRDALHVQRHER